MLGMHKKIGREHVIVPYEAGFEIIPHGFEVNPGILCLKDIPIEGPNSDIGGSNKSCVFQRIFYIQKQRISTNCS